MHANPQNWQELGEQWGDGKKISNQTIDQPLTVYGAVRCSDSRITKNFTCYGSAVFSTTTSSSVATIYGRLTANDCTFKDLDVRCSDRPQEADETVTLTDTTVDKLLVKGPLTATKASLSHITSFSKEITLSESQVGMIEMMNCSGKSHKKASIELIDTVVDGDIIFSHKGGTVICSGTSKVKGRIVGGALIKKA